MIDLDGHSVTLPSFLKIVREGEKVSLSSKTLKAIQASRNHVEKAIQSGKKIYSINTGFGILSKVLVPPQDLEQLQVNFVRSHCAAVGEPHSEEESRAILLLRTNVLAKAYSGVRPQLVELLVEMLNRRVHPVIPSKGSVGASGDLAPLAHLAAVLIGEGEAFVEGKRMDGAVALKRVGLTPIRLAVKEGLSLTNGTQQMTAQAALILSRALQLADLADLICAGTNEGTLGTSRAYLDWVHETRPHEGQKASARNLHRFLAQSEIYESHRNCDRVQDPYSIRCAPQIHGACRDLLSQAQKTVEVELNAATDNPLVHPETGDIVSCGNFHGQPVAFAMDLMGIALAQLSNVSERRIVKLLNPVFSELPTFLIKNEGLNSGFMIAQYTAASLVSESKLLSHPAGTDSIPTNNDKEDINSMGPISARKAKVILKNTQYVLAIEALAACQAIDLRQPLKPGVGPRLLHATVRRHVSMLEHDRFMAADIEKMESLLESEELYRAVVASQLLN
ncbi:MAG: histidine ammonia-lyase [Deltaproteobacteria bacterium]|nr:histidine ammonia-lyase [Deltaproteobacteria bacterium]MBI3293186.1 histidine ammonia-lyase [Deltaproteobacteria bacterium]